MVLLDIIRRSKLHGNKMKEMAMNLHLHQAVMIQKCSVDFWEFCHYHVYFKTNHIPMSSIRFQLFEPGGIVIITWLQLHIYYMNFKNIFCHRTQITPWYSLAKLQILSFVIQTLTYAVMIRVRTRNTAEYLYMSPRLGPFRVAFMVDTSFHGQT